MSDLSTNVIRDAENPRKIEFYDLDASILTSSARELLREYSGIPDDEINRHVEEIREKGFKAAPYPCIGMFQFLDLSMATTDVYPEVLERLKNGEKFLDLGCCFGQEIRKLVFDGAPSTNLYGSDLHGQLIETGYELFKDKNQLKAMFIPADIFESHESSPLSVLEGNMNIIYTGAFFHLFDLDQQEKAAARVVQLLAPQTDSLIIGRQSGSEIAGQFSKGGRKHFQHNAQSWKHLWDRVGEKTSTKWSVEADVDSPEFTMSVPDGKSAALQSKMSAKGLRYIIRRL